MKLARRLTAPLSAVVLIIVAGVAFTQLQGLQARPEYLQPILDPQFDLWVSDKDLGGSRPLVWELAYDKGVGDQVALSQVMQAGRRALEIRIFQDAADERSVNVQLRETIDGARLSSLFNSVVGVWVFQESSYACKQELAYESMVFGLEINDWTHVLTFVFCQEKAEPQQFLDRRTLFLTTPSEEWTYHEIDLAKEYKDAGWKLPERLRLGITLGVPGPAAGWHSAYVGGFSVTPKAKVTSSQQEDLQAKPLPTAPRSLFGTIDARIPFRPAGLLSLTGQSSSSGLCANVTRV